METLLVLLIVGGAATYIGRSFYLQFKGKAGCPGGCSGGCHQQQNGLNLPKKFPEKP